MTVLAGQYYFNLSHGHVLPGGLLSDPPSYATCVSSLEAVAAAAPKKVPGVTGVILLRKCRQLNEAFRAQGVERLIKAQRLAAIASEEGIKVSDPEILAIYHRGVLERFHTASEGAQHLAATHTSVSDELILDKENLLAQKLLQKINAEGRAAQERFSEAEKRWNAKTICSPGYVVQYCSQFTGEPPASVLPPSTVLVEQVATLATGRCINTAACSKQ